MDNGVLTSHHFLLSIVHGLPSASHFLGVGVAIVVHQPVSGTSVGVGVDGACVIDTLQLLSLPVTSDPR